MDIASTADLFEELDDEEIQEAKDGLTTEYLADILDVMEPDEAADLLGDLAPEQASKVLTQMEEAEEILPILAYPDETAGGLMTTWFSLCAHLIQHNKRSNFYGRSDQKQKSLNIYMLWIVRIDYKALWDCESWLSLNQERRLRRS